MTFGPASNRRWIRRSFTQRGVSVASTPRANRVERRPRIDGDNIAHARAMRDVSPVHHESEPGRPSSDASAAARTFKANRSSV